MNDDLKHKVRRTMQDMDDKMSILWEHICEAEKSGDDFGATLITEARDKLRESVLTLESALKA